MPEADQNSRLGELLRAAEREPESPQAQFALGRALQEGNRLAEAAARYERAIALDPNFAEAHCNLGLAYLNLDRPDGALASCQRSVSIKPELAGAHNSLGLVLQRGGRLDEAEACYRRAIELAPHYPEALSNLGAIAGTREQYREAADWFRKAVDLRPDLPQLRYNLGCAQIGLGQIETSISELRTAVTLAPEYWQAWSKLGTAYSLRGRLDEAIDACSKAVRLAPNEPEASHHLGVVLRESDRVEEAISILRHALTLKPDVSEVYFDLAIAYQGQGRLDEAVDAFRHACKTDPGFAGAHCGLGIALAELGLADEAISALTRAIELKPDYQAAQSARLLQCNYSLRLDPREVLALHRRWEDMHARRLLPAEATYPNARRTGRRLRIGYVSPDFRQHSIAFFLTPLMAHHDHRIFEVFCYSDVRRQDELTRQLKSYADRWQDVAGMSDEDVASLVREDEIDILIDLALHSGSNRMLVFARKPAPLQVTWLGYAGTTGLRAMDYKITDRVLDPPGETEAFHTETLFRLPDCYWCYTPPPTCPPIAPLPAAIRGAITFCAFQNLAKVSPRAIELWARVLRSVPRSRLIVKARGLGGQATRARLRQSFGERGIGDDQIEFENWSSMSEYLGRFSEVDIALDTTPFNGGTTTCHALWMGVPMVTLAGRSALGRMGASILQNIGLPDLIAGTPREYIEIAARLADDTGRLAELRRGLRDRMKAAPLTDALRFTANIEAAYRAMWVRWCEKGPI